MLLNEDQWQERPVHKLLSKQGHVIMKLAAQLLGNVQGDTIMRVHEFAEEIGASAGSVHAAMGYLREIDAAQLEGHGRLGTIVQDLNYPLLWSLAFSRPLVGMLPLPYSKRFEGLAMGLRQQLTTQHSGLELRFMRGSTSRLQALVSHKADWVLLSRFAAETADVHGFDVDILFLLGEGTYLGHQILIGHQGVTEIQDGMRVGIDTKSPDHAWVVRTVCRGKRVKFVEIDYSQGLKLLQNGEIDVTVWTREDLPAELSDFAIMPLDRQPNKEFGRLTEATIVVKKGDVAVTHVLASILDLSQIRLIQEDVVKLKRLPAY